MSSSEPDGRPTAHGVVRRADRSRRRTAVELGRGAADGQPQLLGRHRERRGPSGGDAGVGRVAARSRTFVFSCAPDARKARNIAQNPQVCVMIDDTVECVSLEGIATPLDDDDGAHRGGDHLRRRSTRRRRSRRRCASSCSVTRCSRFGRRRRWPSSNARRSSPVEGHPLDLVSKTSPDATNRRRHHHAGRRVSHHPDHAGRRRSVRPGHPVHRCRRGTGGDGRDGRTARRDGLRRRPPRDVLPRRAVRAVRPEDGVRRRRRARLDCSR